MERPSYLSNYVFDWEQLNVIIGGKSALDSHTFLTPMKTNEQVGEFLKGYGFDPARPVLKAELFGYYQEALQFIRRYFLKEGDENDGLELKVPLSLVNLTEINDLFLIASGSKANHNFEDCLWAALVLKVMHTILHADKDLRSNYFSVIQQQIFDRFYKHLKRDKEDRLYLQNDDNEIKVPLHAFETKAKKSRDSIIIKMLHKIEHVAEELFDRVGIRFVTENRVDCLRVIKFLQENYILMAHNIKPSRSLNSLVDLLEFKKKHHDVIKMGIRNSLTEKRLIDALEREIYHSEIDLNKGPKNEFSSKHYRSIQFTCRQLIIFRNPVINQFRDLKKFAKTQDIESELVKKVMGLDLSYLSRDIRFFYPYEIQITDKKSHEENTLGEASHNEYKRSQRLSARNRIFRDLIEYKNIKL